MGAPQTVCALLGPSSSSQARWARHCRPWAPLACGQSPWGAPLTVFALGADAEGQAVGKRWAGPWQRPAAGRGGDRAGRRWTGAAACCSSAHRLWLGRGTASPLLPSHPHPQDLAPLHPLPSLGGGTLLDPLSVSEAWAGAADRSWQSVCELKAGGCLCHPSQALASSGPASLWR